MYQKELDQILVAAETFDEAVFSLADMVHWPDDALEYFVGQEILKETAPASEVECDGCDEKCVEKVRFVDGKKPSDTRAYIVCRNRDDMGPIAVDMERLKRWKANKDKLIELGYCKKPEKSAVDLKKTIALKTPVKEPSKEAKQAYKIYNSASFSQAKVAEIMTNELKPKKPFAQWNVSRWIKECKEFLEANGLGGFSSDLNLNTVTVDPKILDMKARTDGKITGDPRHKKLIDPNNAAYDD